METQNLLELSHSDRKAVYIHEEIDRLLTQSKPRHLHKWQWLQKVVVAGIEALNSDRSNDLAA